MLYQAGCYGGGTTLRLAKDLTENNRGARPSSVTPWARSSLGPAYLKQAAHVRDGVDVAGDHTQDKGRGPLIERTLLEQQTANTAIDAIAPDLNEMFWVVHAGSREILNKMESKLGLGKEKLGASRAVMGQYSNTRSSCVVLVMEEMRRRLEERGLRTPGEGLDMGMLVGFGPGLNVETIILHALPIN
ncbi:hypothetical protein E2562_009352 [Oryza meyeriana var. granulata]|uniref:Chalcone/stilbene synthase C-terminal domain-containing protein n=1 Tax=Oryza meyeriana var. granulata TaxID=110450 RepID=A0A6G1CFD0_9ORYZ|nr:hypothetical protein E2562_009352 [Oryza meyeriana var. granulata]